MDTFKKLKNVPIGLPHLGFIAAVNKSNREQSEGVLRDHKPLLNVLGVALAGLYTSATCHRGCKGGDHIVEALGARIYNLSFGSYSLVCIGLYDEALSLVRSIGEIANLLSLSMFDKAKFSEWVASSKPDRIRNFGPAKVRKLLEKSGIVVMDSDWYSNLCESYTHVTPQTAPNNYDLGRNVCGGIVQPEGAKNALEQLTNITAIVSLYYCRHSGLDDIFDKLADEWRALEDS